VPSTEDTRPSWKSTSASSHSLVLANNFRGHYQIVKDQNKTPGCISAQRQCLPGIVHSRDGSASVNTPGQKFFGPHIHRIIQLGLRDWAVPGSPPRTRRWPESRSLGPAAVAGQRVAGRRLVSAMHENCQGRTRGNAIRHPQRPQIFARFSSRTPIGWLDYSKFALRVHALTLRHACLPFASADDCRTAATTALPPLRRSPCDPYSLTAQNSSSLHALFRS
jgi:hypothetical protein